MKEIIDAINDLYDKAESLGWTMRYPRKIALKAACADGEDTPDNRERAMAVFMALDPSL